ncbi:class I SAM-dependent methyltransferase [Candidatus Parcubacteria bacterium]|nr:class I SAM-dependent methyltransferase [Candidatus Parcubacteria bacterium]
MPKLNLGSGTDIRAGWVNLDSAKLPGVDVVHDIQKLPLPFKDGEFDVMLCRDILQHVDYTPILKDLYRILRPGGKLIIRVPHFTSKNNVIDPTHRSTFSVRTFDFFVRNAYKKRYYYFDFAFSKIELVKITFEHGSRIFFYNRLISLIVNMSRKSQDFYESTGFSRLFPAMNIEAVLIK